MSYLLIVVAIVGSSFYAAAALCVFGVKPVTGTPWSWYVHQVWLNFCGAAFGWGAFGLLLAKFWPNFEYIRGAEAVTVWDFPLALIAFVGITGHLPLAIINTYNELRVALTQWVTKAR